MLVNVWPDRFQKGWDGRSDPASIACHPVVPYTEALNAEYRTDAHFCPAVFDGAEVQPRLMLKMPEQYLQAVRFYVIVLDIDGPNHTCTDEWYSDQISRLTGTPWEGGIYYRTKGGYRLMWELPEPLKIHEYVSLNTALRAEMHKLGIEVDKLTDWTRCFRLPFVRREGKNERRELVVPPNPMLAMSLIKFSRVEEKEKGLGAALAEHRIMLAPERVSEINEKSRNDTLFRLMSSLRNMAWVDEELAISFARVINQERVNPPLGDDEVEAVARNVWGRYSAGSKGAEVLEPKPVITPKKVEEKAKIVCGAGILDELVHECIVALAKHPDVFVRQGELVRVIGTQIHVLPRHALRTCLAEVADFWKVKQSEDGGLIETPSDPPKDLVDCVFENGFYPELRELEQVRTLPGLRPDGAVLNASGYDAETRTLMVPEFTVKLPEVITYEDAVAAKDRIKALYKDFPFPEDCHRAAALALMMTPVLRVTVKGPTPLFLCEAPIRGSGKTLAASMSAIVATGKTPAVMAPTNEEETEKRIVTKLMGGAKIIFIDNAKRTIGGPALEAALTSEYYEARLMRTHELLTLYNGATWMITGNNAVLTDDIVRRTIRILIDPKMEHPEERKGLPDVKKICMDTRPEIVRDILIMALARHASGFQAQKPMGSFDQWSYWVRETLMFLGEADCLDTQRAIKTSAEVGTFGTILVCAFNIFQPKGARSFVQSTDFTAKEFWGAVFEGTRYSGKPEHIDGLVSAYQEMTDDTSLKEVTHILTRWQNRIVNGYKLTTSPERDPVKGTLFRVVRTDKEGNGGAAKPASEYRQSAVAGTIEVPKGATNE